MLRLLSILAAVLLLAGKAHAIILGTDAGASEFPWMAGVVRTDVAAPGLIGGGSLVGDQWVLTAAHSVRGVAPSKLEIWLGTTDLDNPATRRTFGVLAIFVHPDFATDGGTSVNDLALILLDQRVAGIAPLPIVESELDLAEGDAVEVVGWGTPTAGVSTPNSTLQKAAAEILSLAAATMVFGSVIEPVHLPAVDPAGLATPCVGDSGGPLVKNFSGTDRLAGLVSFGTIDCGDATLPTVYTRVPTFASWIGAHLDLTSAAPVPVLSGKGRIIRERLAPKAANGTRFEALIRPGQSRIRTFRLANVGSGWLTVGATTLRGAAFSLRKAPAKIVPPGSSTVVRVRFSDPGRNGRFRGRVVFSTNRPVLSKVSFLVEGKSGD